MILKRPLWFYVRGLNWILKTLQRLCFPWMEKLTFPSTHFLLVASTTSFIPKKRVNSHLITMLNDTSKREGKCCVIRNTCFVNRMKLVNRMNISRRFRRTDKSEFLHIKGPSLLCKIYMRLKRNCPIWCIVFSHFVVTLLRFFCGRIDLEEASKPLKNFFPWRHKGRISYKSLPSKAVV